MSPEVVPDNRQEGIYIPDNSPEVLQGQEANARRRAEMEAKFRRGLVAQGIDGNAVPFVDVANLANEKKGRVEMQAHMRTVMDVKEKDGKQTSNLDKLPDYTGIDLMTKGADAELRIKGKLTVIKGPDERKRMRTIQQRLEKTLSVVNIDSDNLRRVERNFRTGSSYVVPEGNTYELDMDVISTDIRWLSGELRINNPDNPEKITATKEREAVFLKYRNMLEHIKFKLATPAAVHSYATRYGDDRGNEKLVRESCRDPDKVRGAGKFALLLAVGALLTLWAIKDIRKGSISFGTLLLLGAAMFLAQSGPKNSFMASSLFANMSKRVGQEGIDSLNGLSKSRPTAYSHLITTLKKKNAVGGITEENLHLLTEPKSKSGKILNNSRVPEKIARMFIGSKDPGGDANMLERMRKVRDANSKKVMSDLAKANKETGGKAQIELNEIINDPSQIIG